MSYPEGHTYNSTMTYIDIQTPALVLDKSKLSANISRMTDHIKSLGVNLRPHVKTSKSIDVARLATADNFGGITVSTLKEAEYFATHGVTDMTLAACLAPSKLDRVAALRAQGVDLKILIDHPDMATAISQHSGEHDVLIEIDCGEHRTGVDGQSSEFMQIASLLDKAPNTKLAGVLTHAGHSYACRTAEEVVGLAETERAAVVDAAERLRRAGMECAIVSVGSTPTAIHARDLTGVTEARPGIYMFGDLFQAGIGSCGISDIALTVLCTVIAHQKTNRTLIVDAGGLALSKDRSTQVLPADCGYGLVCDAEKGTVLPGWIVEAVHQEHGEISSAQPIDFATYPIGSQLRILPNHSCMTAAAYSSYHVFPGAAATGDFEIWTRCNGW